MCDVDSFNVNDDEMKIKMQKREDDIFVALIKGGAGVTLEELDLTVRTYNILKRSGINSINDITELTRDDLLKLKKFTTKQLREVREEIQKRGYYLSGE